MSSSSAKTMGQRSRSWEVNVAKLGSSTLIKGFIVVMTQHTHTHTHTHTHIEKQTYVKYPTSAPL